MRVWVWSLSIYYLLLSIIIIVKFSSFQGKNSYKKMVLGDQTIREWVRGGVVSCRIFSSFFLYARGLLHIVQEIIFIEQAIH